MVKKTSNKKYTPNQKEKYMCAKHKKFFSDEFSLFWYLKNRTIDKKIRAFNSLNGKEVWSYQLEYVGSGPPSIYSINNEQYIVVASTGSSSLSNAYSVNFGNLLYCFKLK